MKLLSPNPGQAEHFFSQVNTPLYVRSTPTSLFCVSAEDHWPRRPSTRQPVTPLHPWCAFFLFHLDPLPLWNHFSLTRVSSLSVETGETGSEAGEILELPWSKNGMSGPLCRRVRPVWRNTLLQ